MISSGKGKGFSILELMIVVCIIAIISAIMFKSYASNKARVAQKAAAHELINFMKGFKSALAAGQTVFQLEGYTDLYPIHRTGSFYFGKAFKGSDGTTNCLYYAEGFVCKGEAQFSVPRTIPKECFDLLPIQASGSTATTVTIEDYVQFQLQSFTEALQDPDCI